MDYKRVLKLSYENGFSCRGMRVVPVFRRLIFPDIHIPYFVSIYLAVISIWLVPKSFS